MTRITTAFSRDSTADEVVAGVDLTGRRMVVTGAASGIGVETARSLARAGADVTLAVRDMVAGEAVAADIIESTRNGDVRAAHLDLLDARSIDAFAAAWQGPLDVLVCNAGVMATPETRTPEGWELQFAINHLGHFQLALGLHSALAAAGDARIVSVSSSGHRTAPVQFDDLHFAHTAYDPWVAYGQAKTANVLFAVEATRRWAGDGITANALMPGGIWTKLQQHVDDAKRAEWDAMEREGRVKMKSVEQGAATSVLLATSPLLEGIGGRYFDDCNEAKVIANDSGDPGVREWAVDPAAAERLWDLSVELLAERAEARTKVPSPII